MTWSYEELDQRLIAYGAATSVRNNHLLKVFFGIFGSAATIMVLLMLCILSKPNATTGLTIALVAFGILAMYIIVSGRAFHKTNGVFCPHCGASLVVFGNILDDLEEDKLEKPENLECPQCHHVVVNDITKNV